MTNGEDVENAACILVVGRNPMSADPVQWIAIKKAKARGAKLIVIDPFRTNAAELADLWLQPKPGTDAAIALSIMQQMIAGQRHDAAFVQDCATASMRWSSASVLIPRNTPRH